MTQLTAGKPEPLGAHFDGKGVNFTLFSAHAERVELCVFDGEGNEHRYDLPARTGDTWHGYLAGGRPGMHYGFRVHGPWDPAQGHWFNPAKLLIDPCAHRVDGEFKDDPLFHVGYGEPDHRDSASVAPKSVVVNDLYDWEDDAPPQTPWGKTVIYEPEGFLARIFQHEIDHLDGILFIDHISALKRNIILRKLLKTKKSATSAAPATSRGTKRSATS